MRFLITLLVILTLGISTAGATSLAMCRHADVAAHMAALHGPDQAEANAARTEDLAEATAEKQGAPGEMATNGPASAVLPNGHSLSAGLLPEPMTWPPLETRRRSGRSVAPLLPPPLA